MKLFDSELRVMEVLWARGPMTAKAISNILSEEVGWNMNTTYTVIKKCISKGAIERTEPHFQCRALIAKEDVQLEETEQLIGKLYDGAVDKLFAAVLGSRRLTPEQIASLKKMVEELEEADDASH